LFLLAAPAVAAAQTEAAEPGGEAPPQQAPAPTFFAGPAANDPSTDERDLHLGYEVGLLVPASNLSNVVFLGFGSALRLDIPQSDALTFTVSTSPVAFIGNSIGSSGETYFVLSLPLLGGVRYYLDPEGTEHGGWFLRGEMGPAVNLISIEDVSLTSVDLALKAGGGYQFRARGGNGVMVSAMLFTQDLAHLDRILSIYLALGIPLSDL
jgi:hypothetical protein